MGGGGGVQMNVRAFNHYTSAYHKEGRGEGLSEGQESTLGGDEMYAKRVLQIELPKVIR